MMTIVAIQTIQRHSIRHGENMLVKRTMLLLVLVGFWALGVRPAHAEMGLLVVGGGAAEHDRTAVGAAIEGTIRKAGWSLRANLLTKTERDELLACPNSKAPWTCVPASVSAMSVHAMFVVSVDKTQTKSGTSMVIITGKMIATDPPAFAARQQYCEHCAEDRLAQAGTELTQQLLRELATQNGRTLVHITSLPTQATVSIDGIQAGDTDALLHTFPGKHVAIVEKPGFDRETREFVIEEGKTVELSVTLRASPPPPAPSASRISTQSPVLPSVAITAGSALILAGGIAIYRGQQDGVDEKYLYTRATAIGVTTSIIGLGALGLGIYLLRQNPSSAPSASLTSGGAVVGWAGSF